MLKNFSTSIRFIALAVFLAALSAPASAETDEDIAREMAVLFQSARAVITQSQARINDPATGDKGFGPDDVIAAARENYKKTTGHDLAIDPATRAGRFLQAELDAIAAVMNEVQPLINEQGKGFKGFLPAVFARQVAARTSEILKGEAEIKLTAPKEFIRNRANKPDDWEGNVIEKKFRTPDWIKGAGFSETIQKDGKAVFRFIMPEYYAEGCLSCHGEPKGALDITGNVKGGGRLDDLGGAISVMLYQQ